MTEGCSFHKTINLSSNTDAALKWQYTNTDRMIIAFGVPTVLLFGLIGNASFLYVIARVQRMRTITNFYLVNIAVADIIFLTLTSLAYFVTYLNSPLIEDVPFASSIGCTLNFMPSLTCYFASMILVTLVTLERFYAICHPLKHRAINGKGRTFKLVLVCWAIAVIFGALTVTGYGYHDVLCFIWPDSEGFSDIPTRKLTCTSVNSFFWVSSTATETIPFIFAMFGNFTMYTLIIKTLSRRNVGNAVEDPRQGIQMHRVRNQVATMLIVNGTLFFACQTPYRIVAIENFVVDITGNKFLSKSLHDTLIALGRTLFFLNSAINTYVYNALSPFYRNAFREAFGCIMLKNKPGLISKADTTKV